MVVQHNLSAANAQRQFQTILDQQSKSTEKLSSGYKINRAADDAAGLSISEKLRWQIRGLDRSATNIQDGVSLVQVAEGAMQEAENILHRVRELAVQAANDTNTDIDRDAIQQEIDESIKEIDRIATTTNFNSEIYPLYAGEKYAVNPVTTTTTTTTPTPNPSNGYRMNAPGLSVVENGAAKTVTGFQLDFSSTNIRDLDGEVFYDTCFQNCNQIFLFSFDDSTTETTISGGGSSRDSMYVTVGTQGMTTGSEVTSAIATALESAGKGTNPYTIGHANKLYINNGAMTFYPQSTASYSDNVASQTYNGQTYSGLMSSIYLGNMENYVTIPTSVTTTTTETVYDNFELNIQSGALEQQAIQVPLIRMTAENMGIDAISVHSNYNAGLAMDAIDSAIDWMNSKRALFGATQNRLEEAYKVNTNTSENTQVAESKIRDTDMASEMMKLSTANILSQAGQSMMTQAMRTPESVLSLLQ